MSQHDYFEDLCKKCFIKNTHPTKKEIKKIERERIEEIYRKKSRNENRKSR